MGELLKTRFATTYRREALFGIGAGFGSVALTSLLSAADSKPESHHRARANRCIFLMMEGEILARGTHQQLLETSPEYLQIYESQKSTHELE